MSQTSVDYVADLQTELLSFWQSDLGRRLSEAWETNQGIRHTPKSNVAFREAFKLFQAKPVYVSADMSELCFHAAVTFPREPFRRSDFHIETGLVYFETPLSVEDVRGVEYPVRAFCWQTTPQGVQLTVYTSKKDPGQNEFENYPATLILFNENYFRFGTDFYGDVNWELAVVDYEHNKVTDEHRARGRDGTLTMLVAFQTFLR